MPFQIHSSSPDNRGSGHQVAKGVAVFLSLIAFQPITSAQSLVDGSDKTTNAPLVSFEADGSLISPTQDANIGRESKLRPAFGLRAGALYDDNLFLDATNRRSDVEFFFSPSIALGLGDIKEQYENFLSFSYSPSAHVFVDNTSENAVDHDLAIIAQYRSGKLRTKGTGRAQSLSGANREIGSRVQERLYDGVVETAWDITGKTSLGGRAGIRHEDFREGDLADNTEYYLEAFADYAITGKTTFGIGARWGWIETDGARDQDYVQAFARVQTQIGEKLTVSAKVGADRRDLGGSTDLTPLVETAFDYRPREGTTIHLAPYSTLSPSVINPGESYTRTGVNAGLRQRLGSRYYMRLDGGYEHGDYTSAEGDEGSRTDKYWYIKPALGYEFKEGVSAELFYRHAANSSSSPTFDYDSNQVGASLNIQY